MADHGSASRSGTWQTHITIDGGGTGVEELQTDTNAPQRDSATTYHSTPLAKHTTTHTCTDVACEKLLQEAPE